MGREQQPTKAVSSNESFNLLKKEASISATAHLGSQLPILVRGAYYDQYQPSRTPENLRSLDEFLAKIKAELEFTRPVDSKDAFRVVSKVLAHHVGEGQMIKVWEALPAEIRRVAAAQQAA